MTNSDCFYVKYCTCIKDTVPLSVSKSLCMYRVFKNFLLQAYNFVGDMLIHVYLDFAFFYQV